MLKLQVPSSEMCPSEVQGDDPFSSSWKRQSSLEDTNCLATTSLKVIEEEFVELCPLC